MILTAIIEKEPDGGYSAEIAELPGCITEGDTLEELKANLREAAEGWLETARDRARREGREVGGILRARHAVPLRIILNIN